MLYDDVSTYIEALASSSSFFMSNSSKQYNNIIAYIVSCIHRDCTRLHWSQMYEFAQ